MMKKTMEHNKAIGTRLPVSGHSIQLREEGRQEGRQACQKADKASKSKSDTVKKALRTPTATVNCLRNDAK